MLENLSRQNGEPWEHPNDGKALARWKRFRVWLMETTCLQMRSNQTDAYFTRTRAGYDGRHVRLTIKQTELCRCGGVQTRRSSWCTGKRTEPNDAVHPVFPVVQRGILRVSGGRATVSAPAAAADDDVSGPLWLWSEHNGCFWSQPKHMSTAGLILHRSHLVFKYGAVTGLAFMKNYYEVQS